MTVLTILNAPGTEIPDLLTDLGDRDGIELRIAEAETLSRALPGTDVLLMWDFFSRGCTRRPPESTPCCSTNSSTRR